MVKLPSSLYAQVYQVINISVEYVDQCLVTRTLNNHSLFIFQFSKFNLESGKHS